MSAGIVIKLGPAKIGEWRDALAEANARLEGRACGLAEMGDGRWKIVEDERHRMRVGALVRLGKALGAPIARIEEVESTLKRAHRTNGGVAA